MGQYFKPTSIDTMEYLCSHDYDGNGLKLTEHSWIGNHFVSTVESLLSEGGKWYKHRIVWAGDYADKEPGKEENLYGLADKIKPPMSTVSYRYVINHSKIFYVDKNQCTDVGDGWFIHPLPLLTCEGNGRSSGDFRGSDENRIVGAWARDSISVGNHIPEGYEKLVFDLKE
jgi:hypothetical protein